LSLFRSPTRFTPLHPSSHRRRRAPRARVCGLGRNRPHFWSLEGALSPTDQNWAKCRSLLGKSAEARPRSLPPVGAWRPLRGVAGGLLCAPACASPDCSPAPLAVPPGVAPGRWLGSAALQRPRRSEKCYPAARSARCFAPSSARRAARCARALAGGQGRAAPGHSDRQPYRPDCACDWCRGTERHRWSCRRSRVPCLLPAQSTPIAPEALGSTVARFP